MATTYQEYTGNASTTTFSYPFPVLKTEDIKVALNGVTQTTGYTATTSPAQVVFSSAPASGVIVRVYRDTDVDSAKGVYAAGSSIRAVDLNNNQDQVLYALQEEQNQKGIFEEIKLDDDVKIKLGNSDDFTIEYGSDNDAKITSTGDIIYETDNQHVFTVGDYRVFDVYKAGSVYYARVQGTFRPYTDDTYDLGSSWWKWRDLYIDGTAYLDAVDINDGAIDGTTIGGSSPAAGTFTTGTIATADINGGAIDGTTIGASSASTGAFTTLTTTGNFQLSGSGSVASDLIPNNNNSYDLGKSDKQWKDLYVDGTAYIDILNVDSIQGPCIVDSGTSTSNSEVYSAKRAGEIFYEKGTLDDITSGDTWVSDDNKLATTAAIDARIVDLVDDVGGFVPIANETSFPNANPDINNGTGTLVSVPLANNLTSNGSGVITIANGTVGNSTVTINGAANSTTYTQGFGIIVETTTTLNTYNFHRYVPKATEVTTVAGNIANVNTVAGNNSNINTVAGISGNVTTVAGVSANVTTVAGVAANVTTVAGISSNVTTVAGDTTAINNITSNLSAVQGAATNATNAASSATAAASSATSAATSATTATTQATTATTQASTATTQATNAASSASTASTQATNAGNSATTATTQASNSSTSAANALAYKNLALTYRNDANGILTQVESAPYNLADSASTHTAWGNITDTGATAVFANESSNILLTMAEGSSSYNYGSIT